MKKTPTSRHPLYGEIPLLERRSTGGDGREHVWYQYDPGFQPKLPRGAVRGDVTRQQFCIAHDVPKYFYVDEERTCVQCGERFVFSAKEQKHWYETLRFNFNSLAIRCLPCRRQRRSERALREQLAHILHELERHPDDARLSLELAKTTVEYRERTGQGDLARAIAACRNATSLGAEPLYWEARCHELAGRRAKAVKTFQQFLATRQGLARLAADAERRIAD